MEMQIMFDNPADEDKACGGGRHWMPNPAFQPLAPPSSLMPLLMASPWGLRRFFVASSTSHHKSALRWLVVIFASLFLFRATHSPTLSAWAILPVTGFDVQVAIVLPATKVSIWTPLEQETPPVSPPQAEPSPLPLLTNTTCLNPIAWRPSAIKCRLHPIPQAANTTPILTPWGLSRLSAADGTRCWLSRPMSLSTATWQRPIILPSSSGERNVTVAEVQVCQLVSESGLVPLHRYARHVCYTAQAHDNSTAALHSSSSESAPTSTDCDEPYTTVPTVSGPRPHLPTSAACCCVLAVAIICVGLTKICRYTAPESPEDAEAHDEPFAAPPEDLMDVRWADGNAPAAEQEYPVRQKMHIACPVQLEFQGLILCREGARFVGFFPFAAEPASQIFCVQVLIARLPAESLRNGNLTLNKNVTPKIRVKTKMRVPQTPRTPVYKETDEVTVTSAHDPGLFPAQTFYGDIRLRIGTNHQVALAGIPSEFEQNAVHEVKLYVTGALTCNLVQCWVMPSISIRATLRHYSKWKRGSI